MLKINTIAKQIKKQDPTRKKLKFPTWSPLFSSEETWQLCPFEPCNKNHELMKYESTEAVYFLRTPGENAVVFAGCEQAQEWWRSHAWWGLVWTAGTSWRSVESALTACMAEPRGGWGSMSSCEGVCPKLRIWASTAWKGRRQGWGLREVNHRQENKRHPNVTSYLFLVSSENQPMFPQGT